MREAAGCTHNLGDVYKATGRYTQAENELEAALRDTRSPLDAGQRREIEVVLESTSRTPIDYIEVDLIGNEAARDIEAYVREDTAAVLRPAAAP